MSEIDTTARAAPGRAPGAEPVADILPPNQRQLGRYSLLRELRRDRSSVTMLALDPVMHREVLLKAVRLPPPTDGVRGGESDTHALEKAFVRQAQAAGRLHHPHIVTVFEAARVHNIGFLAIERVNGRPLHELIGSGWRPDFVHCASLAARVADAIDYAHNQSVAHGHLGPQHVVVQTDGVPRVEGFGGWIDSGAGGDDALRQTERLLPYFQDEISEETRRRDVHAIVVLLHMMLTGKPPQMRQPDDGGAPRPASVLTLRPDTPPQLARLIDEMLDPAATLHRTAGDLRDVLTAYIWNARKSHVAPATIGIPLAAPPEAASELSAADLTVSARPRSASRVVARGAPSTATRTMGNAADRRAAGSTRAGSLRNAAPAPLDPVARAKRWIATNRFAVIGAAALVFVGVIVGSLLGRHAPIERRAEPAAVVDLQAARPAGIVTLDIQPWGEIFVDGKPIGVAPPMTELKLSAGRHTVEIRHGERAAVSAQVDVDAAKPLAIRHRFE